MASTSTNQPDLKDLKKNLEEVNTSFEEEESLKSSPSSVIASKEEESLSENEFEEEEEGPSENEDEEDYESPAAIAKKQKRANPEAEEEEEEDFSMFNKSATPKAKKTTVKRTAKTTAKKKKICDFCGATETPMWRRGPQGKGTLCNACGVKWSLKFRKKNPTTSKEGEDRKATRKSSRRDKPVSNVQRKPLMMSPGSLYSPSMYSSIATQPPNQQDCFCRYCGQVWPWNYFKHSPQFGPICSSCIKKRSDIADEESNRESKRPRTASPTEISTGMLVPPTVMSPIGSSMDAADLQQEDSQSDIEVDKMSTKLFQSLLYVVENKIAELNELDQVKKQFEDWKEVLSIKEEERQNQLKQTELRLKNEVQDFRRQVILAISDNETSMNSNLQDFAREMDTITRRTESIKRELEDMRSTISKEPAVAALTAKMEALESQVGDIQTRMQVNNQQVREQLSGGLRNLRNGLNNDFDFAERKLAAELNDFRKISNSQADRIRYHVNRVDYALTPSEHTTP